MFNAEISAGALMVVETRQLAKFMLTNPSKEDWKKALGIDNILQKKTPSTAKRQAALIKKRLDLAVPETLELIATSDSELTLQLIFTISLLHSQLHYDFMTKVYGEHIRLYEKHLSKNAWSKFWDECAILDANINTWSEVTKAKLGQVIIKILCQAKYLDSPQHLTITPPTLRPELIQHINSHYPQFLKVMEFSR